MFIVYLHSRAVRNRLHLIAIGEQKINPLLPEKIASHLYAKKWGFGKVFWRMIYSLFTEIALENKNAPFGAKQK